MDVIKLVFAIWSEMLELRRLFSKPVLRYSEEPDFFDVRSGSSDYLRTGLGSDYCPLDFISERMPRNCFSNRSRTKSSAAVYSNAARLGSILKYVLVLLIDS